MRVASILRWSRRLFARVVLFFLPDMFWLPHGLARTMELRKSLQAPARGKSRAQIIAHSKEPKMTNHMGKADIERSGRQWQDIEKAAFFTMTDVESIKLFYSAFGPELEMLRRASPTVESSPVKAKANMTFEREEQQSPSQLLFDRKYAEVDRTLVGMLALKWLIAGNDESFTGKKRKDGESPPLYFQTLRKLFMENLRNEKDVYALLVSTVVNDLGKDPDLPKQVQPLLRGLGYTSEPNHDLVAYIAATHTDLLPLIDEAKDTPYHAMLLRGLLFGAEINIAQLAQGENVPGNLRNVKKIMADIEDIQDREHQFALKFMEIVLDVAGASGHIDAHNAKSMNSPVFQGFLVSRKALRKIIRKNYDARDAYDRVLLYRSKLLYRAGFCSDLVQSRTKEDERLVAQFLASRKKTPTLDTNGRGLSTDDSASEDSDVEDVLPEVQSPDARGSLSIEQTKWMDALSVKVKAERALLRLLAMGRAATKDQAELFEKAFIKLSHQDREDLVEGLNVDGLNDGVAVLPYYMPAIFHETLKSTETLPLDRRIAAVSSVMRFLKRIYGGTKPTPGAEDDVLECSVAFAKDTVQGDVFREDPSVLDDLPIPEESQWRVVLAKKQKNKSDSKA